MENEGEGLTPEQRQHVLHAATSSIIELLSEHPELAKIPAGQLTTVFLAGVEAGVDALDRVLTVGLRDWTP